MPHQLGEELGRRLGVVAGTVALEVGHELREVLGALAQRRHAQAHRAGALTEAGALDRVAVAGLGARMYDPVRPRGRRGGGLA